MHYYKNPNHKGKLDGNVARAKIANLSCGDSIEVFLDIKEGRVIKAGFDGTGCIVSLASAELLCEILESKSIEEFKTYTSDDFFKEIGFSLTPSRQKCALISFKAGKKIIDES